MTNPAPAQKKRLCVLSDVQLSQIIRHCDDTGTPQILFYDKGIGTNGPLDTILGGAFGRGIDENIQQLYTFLCHNYNDGDEVYMFGFSRGAYTVRSLAGFIDECGLCKREAFGEIAKAYELYREDLGKESKRLKEFRDVFTRRIDIELVVCYDTVGSLGIPESVNGVLYRLNRNKYEFHNTKLSDLIQNAIHILAIDENRATLKPTLMEENKTVANQLTQKYFWGTHGGIGGSETTEKEAGLTTLKFTLDEIKRRNLGLAFDETQISTDYPDITTKEVTALNAGFMSFFTRFTGTYVRPIQTIEAVHKSAIERFQINDKWRPEALKNLAEQLLKWKKQT